MALEIATLGNNDGGGNGAEENGGNGEMAPRWKPRPVKFDDDRSLPAYHDPAYPDSLDFHLRSIYNHAEELDASKARIRVQKESAIVNKNE